MSEEHPLRTAAEAILSPVGGAVIGGLFYPVGCASGAVVCASGERVNILGFTMGGLVGTVDDAGAFVIGIGAALICYFLLHTFFQPHA